MFSVLNEIGNNSHFRTTSVVLFSIGLAAFIYIFVAITGYLSFGNAVGGNVVAMCKLPLHSYQLHRLIALKMRRPYHLPSAKPLSSSSSCSHTRSKSIRAEPPLMQSSNGDHGEDKIRPTIHQPGQILYCHPASKEQNLEATQWEKHDSQPSRPPSSS